MSERRLTDAAQAERDAFDADDGCCACHIAPPCGWCTHPGNPLNQEDDECWTIAEETSTTFDAAAHSAFLRSL